MHDTLRQHPQKLPIGRGGKEGAIGKPVEQSRSVAVVFQRLYASCGSGFHAHFGVALRYAEPWALGHLLGEDLADNRRQSGKVTWKWQPYSASRRTRTQ